ncbi:hypothetical protein AT959_14900 [Dechloromonas denitrificans]|uniref:Uncharacterized protein n=1 Tax=Dechloromonas denitrificans TaxID=281362 RepID=A0A133XE94_9RHOO|nr:hypothetical protein [Dechloromonas denitrificans]KXB29262.1 hypothetical protein AT959_14900 [Dechloromonas denitrificans]
MDIVVFRSQAEKAQQEIEGIYRGLVGALSGSRLGEMDGMIYSIEPDSLEAYLKLNIDHLEDVIGRLTMAMKATQKRLLRDQRKIAK